MKLTFIDNACCIVEQDGFRILSDPWLSEGAFEGSWYHYPPLQTKPQDLVGVDALYISHIHPDHYDPQTLAVFGSDIPIVVLDHGKNYLHRALRAQGFGRLIPIADGQSAQLGPFNLTAYKPFATDIFHESKIGNVIDSSLAMEAGGVSIYNGNDNNLTLEAAHAMRHRHGTFNLVLLKYNAASPYPASFMNLDEQSRLAEANRIRQRNLDYVVSIADVLQPERLMPFAGNFIYGGKQWVKNRFLGTATWDEAAAYVRKARPNQKTLTLREGQTFDLQTGEITSGSPSAADNGDAAAAGDAQTYARTKLASAAYPYEADTFDDHAYAILREALPVARANLWRMQQQLRFTQDYNMYVALRQELFHFSFAHDRSDYVASRAECKPPYLIASMDVRLLARIARRAAHWNNAEIGGHIDFYRDPDTYYPDVHVMLSFLHLPAPVAAVA